jgi:hypothetical protein
LQKAIRKSIGLIGQVTNITHGNGILLVESARPFKNSKNILSVEPWMCKIVRWDNACDKYNGVGKGFLLMLESSPNPNRPKPFKSIQGWNF